MQSLLPQEPPRTAPGAELPGILFDPSVGVLVKGCTCSLHCSSFFWFNQLYIQDFIRYPQKGTTMETIGSLSYHNIGIYSKS